MGIYTKLLNEGMFFKSVEAREIQKLIKEICKNNKVKKSFKQRLSSSPDYDHEIKSKNIKDLKKYFDYFHEGPMMKETVVVNGVESELYYCNCIGIKLNTIVKFKLYCEITCGRISMFSEIGNIDNLFIPKEVIEQSFKLINDGIDLKITKNTISTPTNGNLLRLKDYVEKKYPDNIVKSKADYIKFI